MNRPSKNDYGLWDRFLRGDETAFIEIYDHYWYRLFLSAYRRTRSKAVSEELVQELFLKLWNRRGELAIGELENYLFSSIRNATIDYLNKQMVADKYLEHRKVFSSMEANTTQEMVDLNELQEALEKGLQNLSGKSGEIFRLHRIENWSIERIAFHFQLSEKTVHYHITRSVKYIRTYLQEFVLTLVFLVH